jgi:bile acid-coenzyme A ligase
MGCHLVLMDGFDPEDMLRLIEQHRADWLALTQPAMVAVIKLPIDVRNRYDVSSIRFVTHYSGVVAAWVKHAWIDWLGPERIAESYGATDSRGSTWIDGATWLERPGSVGRPQPGAEIAIFDDGGGKVEPGKIGHVYIRDLTGRRNFHYIGKPTVSLGDGWETVGDVGWMDTDGYLYIADRAGDMIETEAGTVAPAPIEGALEYHPEVRSAIVIGLPERDAFQRVHAIVDDAGRGVDLSELDTMLATRFPAVRRPDTWELSDRPLRDMAGKARRPRLRAERLNDDRPSH